MNPDTQSQIDSLKRQLEDLRQTIYLNNFPSRQDFNKYSAFNSTLKVPHYTAAPNTSNIGELIEVGGKLYISTATNTFTVVGTQS